MNYLSYFKNEDEIRKCVAENVLNIRKEHNLTQDKLAEMLDVSVEHISRIENCKYTCSISFIFGLCTHFKMDINEFFHIEVNQSNNITMFLDNLSIEQYQTISEFCEEVRKYSQIK